MPPKSMFNFNETSYTANNPFNSFSDTPVQPVKPIKNSGLSQSPQTPTSPALAQQRSAPKRSRFPQLAINGVKFPKGSHIVRSGQGDWEDVPTPELAQGKMNIPSGPSNFFSSFAASDYTPGRPQPGLFTPPVTPATQKRRPRVFTVLSRVPTLGRTSRTPSRTSTANPQTPANPQTSAPQDFSATPKAAQRIQEVVASIIAEQPLSPDVVSPPATIKAVHKVQVTAPVTIVQPLPTLIISPRKATRAYETAENKIFELLAQIACRVDEEELVFLTTKIFKKAVKDGAIREDLLLLIRELVKMHNEEFSQEMMDDEFSKAAVEIQEEAPIDRLKTPVPHPPDKMSANTCLDSALVDIGVTNGVIIKEKVPQSITGMEVHNEGFSHGMMGNEISDTAGQDLDDGENENCCCHTVEEIKEGAPIDRLESPVLYPPEQKHVDTSLGDASVDAGVTSGIIAEEKLSKPVTSTEMHNEQFFQEAQNPSPKEGESSNYDTTVKTQEKLSIDMLETPVPQLPEERFVKTSLGDRSVDLGVTNGVTIEEKVSPSIGSIGMHNEQLSQGMMGDEISNIAVQDLGQEEDESGGYDTSVWIKEEGSIDMLETPDPHSPMEKAIDTSLDGTSVDSGVTKVLITEKKELITRMENLEELVSAVLAGEMKDEETKKTEETKESETTFGLAKEIPTENTPATDTPQEDDSATQAAVTCAQEPPDTGDDGDRDDGALPGELAEALFRPRCVLAVRDNVMANVTEDADTPEVDPKQAKEGLCLTKGTLVETAASGVLEKPGADVAPGLGEWKGEEEKPGTLPNEEALPQELVASEERISEARENVPTMDILSMPSKIGLVNESVVLLVAIPVTAGNPLRSWVPTIIVALMSFFLGRYYQMITSKAVALLRVFSSIGSLDLLPNSNDFEITMPAETMILRSASGFLSSHIRPTDLISLVLTILIYKWLYTKKAGVGPIFTSINETLKSVVSGVMWAIVCMRVFWTVLMRWRVAIAVAARARLDTTHDLRVERAGSREVSEGQGFIGVGGCNGSAGQKADSGKDLWREYQAGWETNPVLGEEGSYSSVVMNTDIIYRVPFPKDICGRYVLGVDGGMVAPEVVGPVAGAHVGSGSLSLMLLSFFIWGRVNRQQLRRRGERL